MTTSSPPLITLNVLAGNDPISRGPFAQLLAPYQDLLLYAWLFIWVAVLCVVLLKLAIEWRKEQ